MWNYGSRIRRGALTWEEPEPKNDKLILKILKSYEYIDRSLITLRETSVWKIERYAIKAYSNVCRMKWILISKRRYREMVIANDAEQLSFSYSSIQHFQHPRLPQSSIKKWSLRAERTMRFIDVWKYNF